MKEPNKLKASPIVATSLYTHLARLAFTELSLKIRFLLLLFSKLLLTIPGINPLP
jgi:hypothetical protein